MSHRVVVTVPPPGLVAPPPDEPSVTVAWSPSHELTEAQQARQYSRITKLVEKIIEVAKRGDVDG